MKSEQMELMKVIEFPKYKIEEKAEKEKIAKLDVAYKMLKYLIEEGHDFHVVISADAVNELFETDKVCEDDYGILTSNFDEAKRIRIKSDNTIFYKIEGNEY
jgi:hypothetical protein